MRTDTVESVFHRRIQMVYSIGTATRIQCVRVCKERFAAKATDHIHHPCCIISTDICEIARLTEMNLYRSELAVEIDSVNTCTSDKLLQLCQHIIAGNGTEIRKIYL